MQKIFTIIFLVIITTNGYGQLQTVGLFNNDSLSFNGYTLVAPLTSNQTYLIDNCGLIVNEWNQSTYNPAASTYLLEDGTLLRTCNIAVSTLQTGGSGGRIERYDWDDNLIWSYNISDSTQRQHHDIEFLPNGNILVLAFDLRSNADAIASGRDPNFLSSVIWSEKIIELQPLGTDSAAIVWEWYLWDHVVQEFDSTKNNYGIVANHRELIDLNFNGFEGPGKDWIHANSLDYNPTLDQIMISARNYDELWIIDHSTTTAEAASHSGGNSGKGGDILYRWGNSQTYGVGDFEDKMLFGQHDPHWIPDTLKDGGKIMVYNNGLDLAAEISRVQIIDPPVDINGQYAYQQDSAYLPQNPSWSYQTQTYSDFVSGAQQLPNGNTLVCDGPVGTITEVDSIGGIVWEYINPAALGGTIISQGDIPGNNTLFRAYKYPPEYPAFTNRTLIGNVPIELNPISNNCNLFYPTNTTDVVNSLDLKVLGNPVFESLRIENSGGKSVNIKIVNILGTVVLEDNTNEYFLDYDISHLTKGVYFIVGIDEENQAIFKQKIIKL